MAIRILHFADCHLGYVPAWLGASSERRADDFRRTFTRVIDMACDPGNGIDLVVIPGDLFEHHDPGERAVAAARAQFQRLADHHLPVVLVPGNHDGISYAASVYRRETFPGVTLVTNPEVGKVAQLAVRSETVHVYSVAQDLSRGVESIEHLARTDEPGIHVAVLHAAVWANPAWDLKAEDFPIRPEVIGGSGMQYVALGHFHNAAEYDEGGVRAVYCGSTEGRDFGETGPRSVVIAEVSEHGVQIERRECHTRELREVTLDLGEQPAASDAEIAERLLGQRSDKLLVRLRLVGPAEFVPDAEAIAGLLSEAFFYVEVVDETRLVDGALVKRLRDERTIRGLFVQKMLERAESVDEHARETAELALKFGLDEFLRHGER
jgi:exonuclease SbcD